MVSISEDNMNDLIHETTEEARHSSNMIGWLLFFIGCTLCSCALAVALIMSGGGYTLKQILTIVFS